MSPCERCGFALPIDVHNAAGPCEQCALEAATVAAIEQYLRLAADFDAYCLERDERLAAEAEVPPPVDP